MGHKTVEQRKACLRKVTVGTKVYYLVEGDLLMDESQLAGHVSSSEPAAEPIAAKKELVGIVEGGKIVRWRPGTVLSYCILEGFSGQQRAQIANDMRQATQDWEDVCGVKFEHVSRADGRAAKPDGVMFAVRLVDTGGEFIAAAFFPNDPIERREVLIDPSHFTQRTFDSVGVLRHELGHVLGFRHEHIVSGAPAICPKESLENTIKLGDYDPQSVMHYFCGGVGSRTLAITDRDRIAAQSVYGLSMSALKFVD